jgi:RNA polymerase-binding transcription factor
MPTKAKSSTAAKSKRKPSAARSGARKKSSSKTKAAGSGSVKKSAPARAAKRAAPAAKARPAPKAAAKAASKSASRSAPAARSTAAAPKAAKPAPRRASRAAPGAHSNVRQLAARPVAGIAPYEESHGEEYMGEPQREHFRRILGQWKRQLMAEVDRTVHHMQDEAANFPDPNDRATQESEFSLELRARDRERKLIKKIDEALASVSSGDYGYCESCGVEIGIRRLEARPTATLCIDCKTLDEIREKQTGS